MMATLASAQASWQEAKRTRGKLIKDLDSLKKGISDKSTEAQLEALEANIAQLRFHTIATIFVHFKFACDQSADAVLWQMHMFFNNSYRTTINDRFQGSQNIVAKRKVDRLYRTYLKTAVEFYKTYFQRLWALFDLPQLARIGNVLQLEYQQIEQRPDVANYQADSIHIFHEILLHLGDLSRYRQKARDADRKTRDTERRHAGEALLYYSLAHDLKPTSGFAHHQMGIVHTDAKKHMEVVYYLYRSLTAEAQHPNAEKNLKTEFKQLMMPSTANRRSGPPDPNEAFSSWVARLHAHFYRGENFPEHAELEETVLHRFGMMLKAPDTMPLMLKMVLINIAAYKVARSKVETKWTLAASRSCQFILRLNVRAILILVRLLQSELQEVAKVAPPVDDGKDTETNRGRPDKSKKFNAYAENVLPLLRIYTAWLYVYRADIVKYEEHLKPYIYDMYRGIAQGFTTLANECLMAKKSHGRPYTASNYLLSEDVEALGILPASCRLHHDAETGQWKPHHEDCGQPRNSLEEESMSRIHDLIDCVSSLASDPIFPLAVGIALDGSAEVAIVYVEGGKAAQISQEPVEGQTAQSIDIETGLEDRFGHLQAFQDDDIARHPILTTQSKETGSLVRDVNEWRHTANLLTSALPRQVVAEPAQDSFATAQKGVNLIENNPAEGHSTGSYSHLSADGADSVDAESDLSVDRHMYRMVGDFLTPPQLRSEQESGQEGHESSYGMHSSTADEVFGATPTQSRDPRSAAAKELHTLPWGWILPHTPQNDAQRGMAASSDSLYSMHYYAGSPSLQSAHGASHLDQSTAAMGNGSWKLGENGTRPQPDISMLFPSNENGTRANRYGQIGSGFPSRPSTGFSGTHQGVRGEPVHVRQRLGGSTDSSGMSSFHSPWTAPSGYQVAPGPLKAPQGKAPVHTSLQQATPGFGMSHAPFSTAFSQNTTDLPPVNSSWGLQAARPTTTTAPEDHLTYHHQLPQQQPGSLGALGYYPQADNMYQSTVCNGNVYDATTAFGRGNMATKDDPSHFRNAVKGTNMAAAVKEADAYDQAILQSAFLDAHPRPK